MALFSTQKFQGIAFTGNKVHQHIGAHNGDIFFLQDPATFLTVGDDDLDVLTGFLVGIGGIAAAVSEDSTAAFVRPAEGGEERSAAAASFHRRTTT